MRTKYEKAADEILSGRRPHQVQRGIGFDDEGNTYRSVEPLMTQEEFNKLNDRMGYELDDDDELRLVHGRDYDDDDF